MKTILSITLILAGLLMGCGDESGTGASTNVSYNTISRFEMDELCGDTCVGFARWNGSQCDIYMLPYDEYRNDEHYREVLQHEEKHCYLGAYHN